MTFRQISFEVFGSQESAATSRGSQKSRTFSLNCFLVQNGDLLFRFQDIMFAEDNGEFP